MTQSSLSESLYWWRFHYPQSLTINVTRVSEKKSAVIVRRHDAMYGLTLTTVLHGGISLTRGHLLDKMYFQGITEVNIAAKIYSKNIFFKAPHNIDQKGM